MLLTLAAVWIALPTSNDYFPLTPGAEWEYSIVGGPAMGPTRIVYKAKPQTTIEGKLVNPVETWIAGELDSTTYYAIVDGFYMVVGSKGKSGRVTETEEGEVKKPKELWLSPLPFLPVEPKRGAKWNFIGSTIILGGEAEQKSSFTVNGFEKIDCLGKKMDAVKVTHQAEAFMHFAGVLRTKTIDWYVAGIGRVRSEYSVETRGGAKVTYNLIRVEGLDP